MYPPGVDVYFQIFVLNQKIRQCYYFILNKITFATCIHIIVSILNELKRCPRAYVAYCMRNKNVYTLIFGRNLDPCWSRVPSCRPWWIFWNWRWQHWLAVFNKQLHVTQVFAYIFNSRYKGKSITSGFQPNQPNQTAYNSNSLPNPTFGNQFAAYAENDLQW